MGKLWLLGIFIIPLTIASFAAQSAQSAIASAESLPPELDLKPEIQENSPVLQRWRQEIPNVLEEIEHQPSFTTRWRLGYAVFPSTENVGGYLLGVEDIFIGDTALTLSANYQASFNGDRTSVDADLRYYLLPLGWYVNIAPVVGYRYLQTDDYYTDGINLGAKLILPLSRTGAANISLAHTFISPGSSQEVGITTIGVGYSLTAHLRLSTEFQQQNSIAAKDTMLGIILEWTP